MNDDQESKKPDSHKKDDMTLSLDSKELLDNGLSPPPSDAERAAAEDLRRTLENPEKSELEAELAAQARAAAYLFGARAITPALEDTRLQVLRSLQRARQKLDAQKRPRRVSRWRVGVAVVGAVAAAVVAGVLLVPRTPPAADVRAYAKLFPEPFTRSSHASERVQRMLAWRRGQR